MICCENIIKYCERCISLSQEPLPYLQGRFKSPCPRRSGFAIGMAILTCINKHCMSCLLLCSTASTVPKCCPTSSATWGQTISKESTPYLYPYRNWFDVFCRHPTSHLRSMRTCWLSNIHGPSLKTRSNTNSILNLNWNKLEPT